MRRFTQILLAAAVLSCGGDGGVTIDDVVTVTVSPGTATLNSIGATTQLSASSSSGATTFTWNSSTASVATVSSTGLVTAMANGTTTITASVGSATSSGATVTVVRTVASIGLTPATGTLTAGQTLQLTATVEDAGGTAVTPALSWTSSDESIATVSSEGLVTGVDDGSTVISATQDGVSGTADVDVIRDDFMPTGDLTLDGTVEAAEVMIPVGVTVTLTGAAAINATGPVTIAGNITGDCTALEVRGQDAVTISGTLNNVCVAEPEAEPAPLDIVSGAVLTLDDATITSSGDISIANTDPAALAPPDGALARTSQADPEISLVGTTIEIQPSVAAAGEDVIESAAAAGPGTARLAAPVMGGAGTNGKGLNLNPAGLIFVGETVLRSQSGGAGGAATGIHATGGVGGNGGDVFIQFQTGNRGLEVRGDPPFTINVSRGDGGPGGPATATAPVDVGPDRATSVTAVGGKGGGVAGILLTLLDDALFNIDGGFGGPGGSATATAPDGVSATIRALAQHGGNATATGGAGAPGSGDFGEFGGGGGGGGPATATAGKGGDGSDFEGQSKDAADGGSATATGGAAGTSLTFIKSRKGDATALGGNGGTGGAACVAAPPPVSFLGTMLVLSDPASSNMFVFNVPPGGSSLSLSSVIGPVVLPGGTGGDGGVLSADASTPDPIRVDAGIATVGAGGNGGDGGAGLPPGEGGAAGSTPSSGATQVAPVFQPGDEGGSCATPTPRSDFSVMARMTGSSDSSQRSMTLTGSAPWIDVAGTLEEDGTVSLTGNGTMAGTPNIDVSFSGTYDEQAGTLVGSYTMDPNKVISAGHPLVYSLNMEVPPTP